MKQSTATEKAENAEFWAAMPDNHADSAIVQQNEIVHP